MYKKFLYFIFIFIFYFFLVPNISDASSYKTQNLKYNIQVEIPKGWDIIPQKILQQIDNATEAVSGVDQSKNEILFGAFCYTLNENPSAIFRISIRKVKPKFTQEQLAYLTDDEKERILSNTIKQTIKLDKKYGTKTDRKNIAVSVAKVGNLLALATIKFIEIEGVEKVDMLYLIPTSNATIKVNCLFNWNEAVLFEPIIIKILSTIKIGSNHNRGELGLSRREQAQKEATAEAERNEAAVRAHNDNFVGTIRRELPEYFAMLNDPARKAEAAKYQQDVYDWIASKPYAEAAPLMEIAKHGRDVNQVVSLLKKFESERRGGKSKPDPTGALAVPGRGAPTAPVGIGDKDDFDAGWNQVKEIEENIKAMRK